MILFWDSVFHVYQKLRLQLLSLLSVVFLVAWRYKVRISTRVRGREVQREGIGYTQVSVKHFHLPKSRQSYSAPQNITVRTSLLNPGIFFPSQVPQFSQISVPPGPSTLGTTHGGDRINWVTDFAPYTLVKRGMN